MESNDRAEKVLEGIVNVGQQAVSLGAKAIVEGTTGSRVLGDAARVATNAVLDNVDENVKAVTCMPALYAAAVMTKVAIVAGGVSLAPAVVVAVGAAAIVGGVSFALFAPIYYLTKD